MTFNVLIYRYQKIKNRESDTYIIKMHVHCLAIDFSTAGVNWSHVQSMDIVKYTHTRLFFPPSVLDLSGMELIFFS